MSIQILHIIEKLPGPDRDKMEPRPEDLTIQPPVADNPTQTENGTTEKRRGVEEVDFFI